MKGQVYVVLEWSRGCFLAHLKSLSPAPKYKLLSLSPFLEPISFLGSSYQINLLLKEIKAHSPLPKNKEQSSLATQKTLRQ